MDVGGKDPNTKEMKELHQAGKQNKNGTPVSRERDAKGDVDMQQKYPEVQFHPYN